MPFAVDGMPPPARPEDAPAGAVPHRHRRLLRGDGGRDPAGPRIQCVDRHRRWRAGDRRQRDVRDRGSSATARWADSSAINASGVGPLGSNLMWPQHATGPTRFEVVGVVRDVRNAPLGQSVEPAIYFANATVPVPGAVHQHSRRQSRDGDRRYRRGDEASGAWRALRHAAHVGRDSRGAHRGAAAADVGADVLRRTGGAARRDWRLRPRVVVGGVADARAGDSAHARARARRAWARSSCAMARILVVCGLAAGVGASCASPKRS